MRPLSNVRQFVLVTSESFNYHPPTIELLVALGHGYAGIRNRGPTQYKYNGEGPCVNHPNGLISVT